MHLKSYRYRLYPTKDQQKLLRDTFFVLSLSYNECLARRKTAYEERGETLTAYDQQKDIASWVGNEPWKERIPHAPGLDIVYAQVRNEVPVRLEKAYKAFFRRAKMGGEKPGFPKFRSARHYDSLSYTQQGFTVEMHDGTRLTNSDVATGHEGNDGPRFQRLKLSKIGSIKVRWHRPLQGKIKTCTIRRTAGGWYACIVCETVSALLPVTDAVVGLDMGLEHLVTTSDSEHIAPAKHLLAAERRLRVAQRRVSRRVGGKGKKSSRRRRKAIWALGRIHQHVANQRRHMAHDTARKLVNRYSLIAVENLNIRGMVRNHHLAKAIMDAAWGQLISVLESKATDAGRQLIKVDPKYTSQICSGCGALVPKKLSERTHRCSECGLVLQRDVNAARNVLTRALRELEVMGAQAGGSREGSRLDRK